MGKCDLGRMFFFYQKQVGFSKTRFLRGMEFRKVEVFNSPPVVGETSSKIVRFQVHLEYTFPQKKTSLYWK